VHLITDPLVATYSIVARDAATGQLGVAVQSCYVAVGAAVPWGEAGVGVVATQSFASVDFGPEGLAMMRDGVAPADALRRLLDADPRRGTRQVALLDSQGRAAAHTGSACVAAAGHRTGDGVSVQANMMTDDTVWPAMLVAYERASGDLAARLVAALEAAEASGGDIRGRQSAALLVVAGARAEKPWQGRLFDLRVDDHADPVTEIARVLRMKRAQNAQGRFVGAATAGHMDEAAEALREAMQLAPQSGETRLAAAMACSFQGRHDEARRILRDLFDARPHLAEWMSRMIEAGYIPQDPTLLEMIGTTRPPQRPQ
jgi:uncharacterized Ntn-hydrolase superfamily protein